MRSPRTPSCRSRAASSEETAPTASSARYASRSRSAPIPGAAQSLRKRGRDQPEWNSTGCGALRASTHVELAEHERAGAERVERGIRITGGIEREVVAEVRAEALRELLRARRKERVRDLHVGSSLAKARDDRPRLQPLAPPRAHAARRAAAARRASGSPVREPLANTGRARSEERTFRLPPGSQVRGRARRRAGGRVLVCGAGNALRSCPGRGCALPLFAAEPARSRSRAGNPSVAARPIMVALPM